MLLWWGCSEINVADNRDVSRNNTVTQAYLDEIAEVDTDFTRLVHEHYGFNPLWDET